MKKSLIIPDGDGITNDDRNRVITNGGGSGSIIGGGSGDIVADHVTKCVEFEG